MISINNFYSFYIYYLCISHLYLHSHSYSNHIFVHPLANVINLHPLIVNTVSITNIGEHFLIIHVFALMIIFNAFLLCNIAVLQIAIRLLYKDAIHAF